AIASDDAWAVGYYLNQTSGATQTFTARWNGTGWNTVASPNPGGTASAADSTSLFSVTASSATDAWAVGSYISPSSFALVTLVFHWNGTSWARAVSPNPCGTTSSGDSNELLSVTASATNNAWSVGDCPSLSSGAPDTVVVHWNGTGWSKV